MTPRSIRYASPRRLDYRALLLGSAIALTALVQVAAAKGAPGSILANSPGASGLYDQDAPIVTNPPQVRLNPTGRDILLEVPLRERTPLGQVGIRIAADDTVSVSSQDLQASLARVVTLDALNGISGAADAEGWLSFQQLDALGYVLAYDPALIELVIQLPGSARSSQSLDLGFATAADEIVQPDQSAPFSVYATYRVAWDYVHQGQREGLRTPRVDLDINGRVFRRFAFENQFTYDDDQEQAFVRQSSRLIFDQPDRQLRWQAGDLDSQPLSFQGQEDVAGVGVQRLYRGFSSGRTVTSTSARQITLERDARVDVIINGAQVRTLQLAPGTYDISDLPLTAGANEVQLVIEDALGGRQVVDFDFFSDFLLLQPGVDEFDFQAGIRAPFEFGERDYRTSEAIATGFYRRGIADNLTLGGNFQISEDAQQVGGEAVFASRLGLFKTDLAVSNAEGAGAGYAARLEYRYSQLMTELPGARRFDAAIEVRSEDFTSIDALGPQNQYSVTALARYAQPLSAKWTGSIGADYAFARDGQEDRYGASAFVSYDYSANTNVNFGLTYQNSQFDTNERDEFNLRIDLVHRFGVRSTVNASYESAERRARVGFTRGPERPLDDFSLSADIETDRDTVAVDGTVAYFTNRGEVELAHQTAFDQEGDEIVSQVTSLRGTGSIAFANGRFAIGRPLYDGFAIVRPHPTLEDRPVLIRGRFSQYPIARSGLFGPALVPLASYNTQTVPFDVEDLPLGYDLGTGTFELYPWLNAGFTRVVGSSYNVTVIGTLLDAEGQPLALTYGVAESIDDPSAPKVELFTNRVGRYGASGLSDGRWIFKMSNGAVYSIDIDDSGGNLIRSEALRPTSTTEVAP